MDGKSKSPIREGAALASGSSTAASPPKSAGTSVGNIGTMTGGTGAAVMKENNTGTGAEKEQIISPELRALLSRKVVVLDDEADDADSVIASGSGAGAGTGTGTGTSR